VVELLQPNDVIFHRYKVEEAVAAGGQSFGFRGQDLQAPPDRPWLRTVFIKQYHDLILRTREATALAAHFEALNARLNDDSRYLCLPLHVGEVNNSIAAVFPFVRGRSLQKLMDDDLTQDQRVRFAQAITNAVRILHKVGIAHLDLKPENILIEENRKSGKLFVRLIDTDGAQIDGIGLRAKVLGTKWYMSPEHFAPARYGHVSVSSDVFTLGVLLFELLFDEHPFPDEPYYESVESEAFEVPPNSYHRDVVDQIVSCLHAYPTMRTQAGWVHSALHHHHATNLEAVDPHQRWRPRYVQVSAGGFMRTYYGGVHLGRNHFRGSALTGMPAMFLRLRMTVSGPVLELTDSSVDVRVANTPLARYRPKQLSKSESVTIQNIRFNFAFRD
jgi:serine/threonine protein kinase